jgi:calcineurin-like phosphoesterase family protein
MKLFSADFHLGHKVIVPKYRDFISIEEHDNLIFDQMAKLKKRDILYIVGDFLFDSEHYDNYIETLSKMSCRIKLIMGNHDSMKLYKETRLPKLEIQLPLFSHKNYWISHCPIHPQELRNRYGNIHGHLHQAQLNDDRYFEVGLDQNNNQFVDFDYIQETFKKKGLLTVVKKSN